MLQWRGRPVDEVGYVLIGALALMLGTGAIYLNWQQAQRTSLQASQTRQSVGTIRQLLVMLYRGEAGQRGFLLTEEKGYLVPYEEAAEQLPKILERLNLLAQQQPAVRERVREIGRLARAKMGELQTAVELLKEGDLAAAELLVRSNFGKQTMDQLVGKLTELEKRVFVSEEEFSAELQEQMRRSAALTVICCLALFALFAIENRRVTNRKLAAEKASEVKGAFLASMSHELRTPLNVIIGYAQMQQEEAEEASRAGDLVDLKRIESAAKHLLVLINEVLELSKIEAGRLDVIPTEFVVEELVREVTGLVEPLAKRQENGLTVELGPGAGRMFSDATRIKQGLLNLTSNAAKFTAKGTITLRVSRVWRQNREWIDFAVTDTGPGIRKDDLARLFEPFSQVDEQRPKQVGRQEGTGLGLAITRRLCRLLGGDVVVETAVGKGSTFTMQLPVEVTPGYFSSKGLEQAGRSLAVAPGVGEEMLMKPVSDEILRAAISRHWAGDPSEVILVVGGESSTVAGAIGRLGWRTVEAAEGLDGLVQFGAERPGLVVADLEMVGMDGLEFVRQLRLRTDGRTVPVVVLSEAGKTNRGIV